MHLRTAGLRVAATLVGLATALSVAAPLAAQAATRTGYADLAHAAEIKQTGAKTSGPLYHRGTGNFQHDPDDSLVGDRPLARLLPKEHGRVYWQTADSPDHERGLSQELTTARSDAAAHDVGMALYDQVKTESHHARHAIAIDGGSLTWFHMDNQGPGYTLSVIRVGRRVSIVALTPQPHHRDALLVAIADRMR